MFNFDQSIAARQGSAAAAAANRLSRFALVGLIGGIATSFLGMNFVTDKDYWPLLLNGRLVFNSSDHKPMLSLLGHSALALTFGGAIVLLGGLLAGSIRGADKRVSGSGEEITDRLSTKITWFGGIALAIGLALIAFGSF